MRLFPGCTALDIRDCGTGGIAALPNSVVTLRETTLGLGEAFFALDDDDATFSITWRSDSYARWFFPGLASGTYRIGLFLSMETQAQIFTDDTSDVITVTLEFGGHMMTVKRVESSGSCGLVEV